MVTFGEEVSKALNRVYNDDATPESVAEWYIDEMVTAYERNDEDPEIILEKLEDRLDQS